MWFYNRKRKILIIDDDNSLRALTKALLNSTEQYHIHEACNVNEAIEKMKETRFDILLLDLKMPDRSGFEILKMMTKEEVRSIPTIVMTSDQKFGSIEDALDLGAAEYITKPFVSETLHSKLSLV